MRHFRQCCENTPAKSPWFSQKKSGQLPGCLQNYAAQPRAAVCQRRLPLKIRMFSYETAPEPFLVLIAFSSSSDDFLRRWHLMMLRKNLKRHFQYKTVKLKVLVFHFDSTAVSGQSSLSRIKIMYA